MFDMQCIDPTSVGDIDIWIQFINIAHLTSQKLLKHVRFVCKSQLGCQVHSNLDSFINVYNGVQIVAPQGIIFFNMSNALLLNQKT